VCNKTFTDSAQMKNHVCNISEHICVVNMCHVPVLSKVKFCTECIQPYQENHSCPEEQDVHHCILCNIFFRNFTEFIIHCSEEHNIPSGNLAWMLVILAEHSHIPINPLNGTEMLLNDDEMLRRIRGRPPPAAEEESDTEDITQYTINQDPSPNLVICAKCFQKLTDGEEHVCKTKEAVFKCPICAYFDTITVEFTTLFNVCRHLKNKHGAYDFSPECCIEFLTTRDKTFSGFVRVDNTLVYRYNELYRNRWRMKFCVNCAQQYDDASHQCFSENICFVCDRRATDMIEHMATHCRAVKDPKSYAGFIKYYASMKGYTRYGKTYSLVKKICVSCLQPMRKRHNCETSSYLCLICDRRFDTLNDLLEHISSHPTVNDGIEPLSKFNTTKFEIVE
jgi:hypothetical protein